MDMRATYIMMVIKNRAGRDSKFNFINARNDIIIGNEEVHDVVV